MIRLIVLYNLHPFVDEEEFLEWRLGPHQEANMTSSNLLRSDFVRICDGWPEGTEPPYRFMTTADWPDLESFYRDFLAPETQERLQEDLKMLKDPIFMVSEILVSETKHSQKEQQ